MDRIALLRAAPLRQPPRAVVRAAALALACVLCLLSTKQVLAARSANRSVLRAAEAHPMTPAAPPASPADDAAAPARTQTLTDAEPPVLPTATARRLPGAALDSVLTRLAVPGAPTPAREVDRWTTRFAVASRAETESAIARMYHYRPLIHGALAEHQLPGDLIYLALIESNYRNEATSRAGAAGIWQFMPATARAYGLEVSAYVDERRDPIRSTYAAARHLSDLYREFASWHTAAAAYNAGQGRVGNTLHRTVGRSRGSDLNYWQGRARLPRETRDYVPKLLAAARVASDPTAYGLQPDTTAPPLHFAEVRVPGGTPLDTVARRLGLRAADVYELNPHLVRKTTPPGRRWPVRIPTHTGQAHP